jgi:hypothetical protein
MGEMTILGGNTSTTIYKKNGNEIHQEFVVAEGEDLALGQPVELNTNGTVEPLGAASVVETACIGMSLHKAAAGVIATVMVRGRAIIYARAAADVDAGPVKFSGTVVDADVLPQGQVNTFENLGGGEAALHVGWSLDSADEGGTIRVLLKS